MKITNNDKNSFFGAVSLCTLLFAGYFMCKGDMLLFYDLVFLGMVSLLLTSFFARLDGREEVKNENKNKYL